MRVGMGVRDMKPIVVPLLYVLARLVFARAVRASDYSMSTKLHIVNGTESIVREGESNFLFCYASLRNLRGRAPYTVVWTDPWGRPLLPLSGISLDTRLFSFRENELRPNAYMVFQMFDEGLEGVYTCNLVFRNRLVSLRRIRLKMFRPSYKVVTLAPCLAVQEGSSALLPSPVVGRPPSAPVWSKLGGSLDPPEAQAVQAGLVLHDVQGRTSQALSTLCLLVPQVYVSWGSNFLLRGCDDSLFPSVLLSYLFSFPFVSLRSPFHGLFV